MIEFTIGVVGILLVFGLFQVFRRMASPSVQHLRRVTAEQAAKLRHQTSTIHDLETDLEDALCLRRALEEMLDAEQTPIDLPITYSEQVRRLIVDQKIGIEAVKVLGGDEDHMGHLVDRAEHARDRIAALTEEMRS